MSKVQWSHVLKEFGGLCVFCGSPGTRENRGIVPDHLVPVTKHGELIPGNTVPACQTCNDSRGERDWRPFLRSRFPGDGEAKILDIEAHVALHAYEPVRLEAALSPSELRAYEDLLLQWQQLLLRARELRDAADLRRRDVL